MFLDEGEIFPMMNVFVFIVKDYCNNRVSFDYRKAATVAFFPLDKAFITFPNVVKERFMFFNYCKWSFCKFYPL